MSERRFWQAALAAVIVSVLQAGALNLLVSNHGSSDTPRYIAAAKALLHGNYSTPIADDLTGPSAPEVARTPGYPIFLAAFGGGKHGASRVAVLLAQALLTGATTFVLIAAVRRFWSPNVALLSGWAYALDPFSKRYATLLLSETLAAFLVVATVYAIARAVQGRSRWWAAVTGAFGGASALVRPSLILIIPFAALCAAVIGSGPGRSRVTHAAVVLLAGAVVVTPWIARNAALTGKPVLGGWGDGINLLLAAHGEGRTRSVADVIKDPAVTADVKEAQRLLPSAATVARSPDVYPRELVRVDERLRSAALHTYRARLAHEPLAVLSEYAYRAYFFWMPYEDPDQYRPAKALTVLKGFDLVTLALAVAGAALAIRRRGLPAAIAGFMIAFMLVSAVLHTEARYSQPVRPLFLTLAAAGLLAAVETIRRRSAGRAVAA